MNGTEDLPVNITDLGTTSAKALGMAFTNGCTTSGGTDDRHEFYHTNFENMSMQLVQVVHGALPLVTMVTLVTS